MNKRITIQSVTSSTDSYGAATETWATFAIVWASVEPLIGKEYLAAKQTESAVSHKFRIRYLSGLTPQMRIYWDSRYFTIASDINVNEGNREMVVMAEEVV